MKAGITAEIYIQEYWRTQTNLFTAIRCNMGDLSTNKPEEQLLRSQMNHISHEEDNFT
jgi:hypothetical protein